MPDALAIALRFVEEHPSDAARVLDRLAPDRVAEFFADRSVAGVSAVLESMAARQVAAVFRCTRPSKSAELAATMSPQAAAVVLRLLSKAERDEVLARCQQATVSRIRRHLDYASDAVGAWMESDVVAIRESSTLGQLLEVCRSKGMSSPEAVLVTGEHGRYVGLVQTRRLLGASDDEVLSRHVSRGAAPLLDHAPLASVHASDDWNRFLTLPVVDRHRRAVGLLSWSRLREALSTLGQGTTTAETSSSGLIDLTSTYYAGMTSLLRAVIEPGQTESAPPAKEKPDGR